MRLLSRQDLLQMSDAEVIATAECHGLAVEGLSPAEALEELADFLDGFRAMAGEG